MKSLRTWLAVLAAAGLAPAAAQNGGIQNSTLGTMDVTGGVVWRPAPFSEGPTGARTGTNRTINGSTTGGNITRTGAPVFRDRSGGPSGGAGANTATSFTWSSVGGVPDYAVTTFGSAPQTAPAEAAQPPLTGTVEPGVGWAGRTETGGGNGTGGRGW